MLRESRKTGRATITTARTPPRPVSRRRSRSVRFSQYDRRPSSMLRSRSMSVPPPRRALVVFFALFVLGAAADLAFEPVAVDLADTVGRAELEVAEAREADLRVATSLDEAVSGEGVADLGRIGGLTHRAAQLEAGALRAVAEVDLELLDVVGDRRRDRLADGRERVVRVEHGH